MAPGLTRYVFQNCSTDVRDKYGRWRDESCRGSRVGYQPVLSPYIRNRRPALFDTPLFRHACEYRHLLGAINGASLSQMSFESGHPSRGLWTSIKTPNSINVLMNLQLDAVVVGNQMLSSDRFRLLRISFSVFKSSVCK